MRRTLRALTWIAVVWTVSPCAAQENRQKSPVKSQDSVTVTATLTPEEKEDWKINEVYQPIFSLEQKRDCDTAIQRYQANVIPLAEQSKFDVPKNKFLYLANRGMGNCYMTEQRYDLAEQSFRKTMDYLPIWPGIEDSDYPINFQQIAAAQMGQQHWNPAAESLKTSISLFDERIEKALKSANTETRSEYAGHLRGSKARSVAYLAFVYLREGQVKEAIQTADLAYEAATGPNVPVAFLNEVVKLGRSIAQASGDESAIAMWSRRASAQK